MADSFAELPRRLDRTNELLTALVGVALAPVMEQELQDKKNKTPYELTGGGLPVKALAAKTGLGTGTISRTWQRWETLGLLVKGNKKKDRKVLG